MLIDLIIDVHITVKVIETQTRNSVKTYAENSSFLS